MKKRPGKNRRNYFRKIFLAFVLFCMAFLLFGAIYIFRLDAWNDFDPDKILNVPETLIIYDKEGNEVSRMHGPEDRVKISIDEVPDIVQKAFISAEDARFYDHIGIDFIRIAGAAWEDIKAGAYVQGASTISQQLVKLSHLTSKKTMSRKLEEAVLAYQMEQAFSKDEILEMYLNYVYFGGGYYGLEAAAQGYFGISASELSASQGALLAGILKSTSNYAPHLDLDASVRRRDIVLRLMRDYGYLSEEEYIACKNEPVIITRGTRQEMRGYYIDYALRSACDVLNISMDELLTGGYRLYTAMNTNVQLRCAELFEDEAMFPTKDCQAALVLVNAKTGYVEALMGGRDNEIALAYNRATEIRRQPGSVIKPIMVYAPALESFGFTASTMLLDTPTDFNGYMPKNYGDRYNGWVTLREAVMKSLNVPAVKVLSTIGVKSGTSFAKKMGLEFDERDDSLALALGGFTYGVSPYQIAGAFASFAAGGTYEKPTPIISITDADGNVLYEHKADRQKVMSEQNAYILTSLLQSAIEEDEGTGRRLGDIGIPLAGKTGTVDARKSNGNRDAWMAAYNPEYAAAVWMGYDNSAGENALPKEATGGTYPAFILKEIFIKLYEGKQAPDFKMPPGVKTVRLDKHTLEEEHEAVLATPLTPLHEVITEVYVEGTEPKGLSGYWVVPSAPLDLSCDFGADGMPQISFTPPDSFAAYGLYRRDENGVSVKLAEFEGIRPVKYTDKTARFGKSYEYYVIPYHPKLVIDGRVVTGPASRYIKVMMPEYLFSG